MFAAFPLWYVLGLGAFIWPILALPMLGYLLVRGRYEVPRGFAVWLLFLLWTALSAVGLASVPDLLTYLFRASAYVSGTILFLYLLNTPSERLRARGIVAAMTGFWVVIVAGGYLALLFPHVSFSTMTEQLLPQAFLSNQWLRALVHPSLAQEQALGGLAAIGHPISRPAAPFAYTNWWGGNYSILLPFVLVAVKEARSKRLRLMLAATLVLSVVPLIFSVNRGAWISLGVAFLYAAARMALRGNTRGTAALLVLLAVLGLAILVSPLQTVVQERLQSRGSTDLRLSLYEQSIEGVMHSPLIGYGVPLPQPLSRYALPNVGTQGQLWLLLVSVGFPGAIFFLSWMVYVFWSSRRFDNGVGFAAHIATLIALCHLPFYGLVPVEMQVFMVAAAFVWRRSPEPRVGSA